MNQNTLNILILDDDEGDRKQTIRTLKKSTLVYQYTEAVSLEQAIEACNKQVFDCAIIDYHMPQHDGLYIITALHEHAFTFPIIMVTGQGDETIATEAMKHGASDYLVKHKITPTLLQKTILDAIAKYLLLKQLQEKENKIDHMAYYDYLTDIPNRFNFDGALSRALSHAKRHQEIFGVLLLDLDRFKNINDALGHQAGDLLLKQVTARFKSIVREEDFLARLGGDEFSILTGEIYKTEDAALIAKKLIHVLKEPFLLGTEKINITTSIGIAIFPFSAKTASELMRYADKAMYYAKNHGRNNFQFYLPESKQQMTQNLYIENALYSALTKQEFYLCYQPIYSLGDIKLCGVEALLRWKHPIFHNIPIIEIIMIAEESGLIIPIGDWIINEAFRHYKEWKVKNKTFKLALNISPQQLLTSDWTSKIQKFIENHQIDPHILIFELTETNVIKNMISMRETLTQIVKLGVQIYIDDFGMGYSSLSMIKNLPISGLKIDKSSIQNIAIEPNDKKLVESLFLLANNMGYSVVVEGIETKTQLDLLKSHATDSGQGFYLAKPMSSDEVAKLLSF